MAGQAQTMQGSGDAMSVAMRPLSKGMHTNVASQLLESGAGRDVAGLIVDKLGLKGMSGFKPLVDSSTADFGRLPLDFAGEVVESKVVFYGSLGQQELLVVTNKAVYRSTDLINFARIPWGRAYTQTSIVTNTLTVSGSYMLTDKIHAGMSVKLQRTTGGQWDLFTIQSVTDATHIVLVETPAVAYNGTFYIYETFVTENPRVVQHTAAPGAIYFVDYTAYGIRSYSGAYMSKLAIHNENGADSDLNPAPFTGASSIAYVAGRLLVGGCIENGAEGRKTFRWSSATDLSEFATTAYTVFANDAGEVVTLRVLEEYPIVFLATGIYAGTPYGYDATDTDPWIFKRLEAAGRAACSPRGVANVPNGIAYVTQNDLCIITSLQRTEKGEFSVDSMNCPVLRDSLERSPYRDRSIAFYDTKREAVGFCFPSSPAVFTDIWYFFTRTQEWSHRGEMPFGFTEMGDLSVAAAMSWQSAQAQGWTWTSVPERSWASFLAGYPISHVTGFDANGIAYVTDDARGYDTYADAAAGTTARYDMNHVFETGDLDLGAPDDTKIAHALSLRISGEDTRVDEVDFRLLVSRDKGRTWRDLGVLHVTAIEDEEEKHFRFSGTNLRFRLSWRTGEVPFTLEEIVFRIRLAGAQIERGSD